MPLLTIGSLTNVIAGQTTEASPVMEAFYKDGMGQDSLEIINGQLDGDNLKTGDSIGISQIKQHALANGKMIGQTGNLDYFARTFPSNAEDNGAFTPIPGSSVEFYLPHDCTLVIFTWMVTIINTMNYTVTGQTTAAHENSLRFTLDGDTKSYYTREVAVGQDTTSAGNPVQQHRTRLWSGHYLAEDYPAGGIGLSQGWHSAQIEIFINADMSRVRIRNMKVLWFK